MCSTIYLFIFNIVKYKYHLPSKVIRLLKTSTSSQEEATVKRFNLTPDTTKKLDTIYKRMIFQDTGNQATKDSHPCDMGNKQS